MNVSGRNLSMYILIHKVFIWMCVWCVYVHVCVCVWKTGTPAMTCMWSLEDDPIISPCFAHFLIQSFFLMITAAYIRLADAEIFRNSPILFSTNCLAQTQGLKHIHYCTRGLGRFWGFKQSSSPLLLRVLWLLPSVRFKVGPKQQYCWQCPEWQCRLSTGWTLTGQTGLLLKFSIPGNLVKWVSAYQGKPLLPLSNLADNYLNNGNSSSLLTQRSSQQIKVPQPAPRLFSPTPIALAPRLFQCTGPPPQHTHNLSFKMGKALPAFLIPSLSSERQPDSLNSPINLSFYSCRCLVSWFHQALSYTQFPNDLSFHSWRSLVRLFHQALTISTWICILKIYKGASTLTNRFGKHKLCSSFCWTQESTGPGALKLVICKYSQIELKVAYLLALAIHRFRFTCLSLWRPVYSCWYSLSGIQTQATTGIMSVSFSLTLLSFQRLVFIKIIGEFLGLGQT